MHGLDQAKVSDLIQVIGADATTAVARGDRLSELCVEITTFLSSSSRSDLIASTARLSNRKVLCLRHRRFGGCVSREVRHVRDSCPRIGCP